MDYSTALTIPRPRWHTRPPHNTACIVSLTSTNVYRRPIHQATHKVSKSQHAEGSRYFWKMKTATWELQIDCFLKKYICCCFFLLDFLVLEFRKSKLQRNKSMSNSRYLSPSVGKRGGTRPTTASPEKCPADEGRSTSSMAFCWSRSNLNGQTSQNKQLRLRTNTQKTHRWENVQCIHKIETWFKSEKKWFTMTLKVIYITNL